MACNMITATVFYTLLCSFFIHGATLLLPHYVLDLVKVTNCLSNKQSMMINANYTASGSPGSNTWTVYEDITPELNITVKPTVHLKKDNKWIVQRVFSGNYYNWCFLINYDLAIVPTMRLFIALPQSCPIKKGIRPITNHKGATMIRPTIPIGCWLLKIELFNHNGNPVGCDTVVALQTTNTDLEKDRKSCN